MQQSFCNKILHVDLTSGTTEVKEPGAVFLRRYLGGWNVILDFLLREVPKGADPLGPDNVLVFATGVLTGLPISGAGRHAVGAKSPLTGGFGGSECGGHFGTQLKQAGFDAVVIKGASAEPVYLWIVDGKAELRDATQLWGKKTKDALAGIEEDLGERRIQASIIGPGAENMVRYANIMANLDCAAGRTGMGAVMGSKRLKAVVVQGSERVTAADADALKKMSQELRPKAQSIGWLEYGTGGAKTSLPPNGNMPVNNFRDGELEGTENLDLRSHIVGKESCYACATRCKIQVESDGPYKIDPAYGGPEYETVACLGTCCGVTDGLAVAKAGELCNAYSMDTISTGVSIAMAMECFEHGILTLEDTDGIELRFGNADAMVAMVEKIARREGLGDILAEGTGKAAKLIGKGAEKYAMHVKNQSYPAHDPRIQRGLALGYAISPTGADHIQGLADQALQFTDDTGFPALRRLRSMGIVETMTSESLGPDKVRAETYHSMIAGLINCLPYCLFTILGTDTPLSDLVDMTRAATGWDVSAFELLKAGERAFTLARVFNVREGLTAEDDALAERSFGPTENGPLVDSRVDPVALEKAIHLYYAMMGWDPDSGVPLAAKLLELDVGWAVEHLPGN